MSMKPLGLVATGVGVIGTFWTWRLLQWFISAQTLTQCLIGETCPIVFTTAFSHFLGVPIHLFALAWFIAMTILSVISSARSSSVSKYGFVLGSLSVPTVIYLDYVQLAIIRAICWDCVTAHVLGLILFGIFALMFVADRRVSTED